ncbi:MAG: hypothetical protein QOG69_552, partial [Actinomycetota bacterium]|nr:hypothetical protein [Actinomycetota bacterium]
MRHEANPQGRRRHPDRRLGHSRDGLRRPVTSSREPDGRPDGIDPSPCLVDHRRINHSINRSGCLEVRHANGCRADDGELGAGHRGALDGGTPHRGTLLGGTLLRGTHSGGTPHVVGVAAAARWKGIGKRCARRHAL